MEITIITIKIIIIMIMNINNHNYCNNPINTIIINNQMMMKHFIKKYNSYFKYLV